MKKFTVKDFIDYNAPCFSCGKPISLHIGVHNINSVSNTIFLKPVVTPDYTEVDLKITYSDFLRLVITHKTNKFHVNNARSFENYLMENMLFLFSKCNNCGTVVESGYMKFDMSTQQVQAVNLAAETIKMSDDNNNYRIMTAFNLDRSNVVIVKNDTSINYKVFNMDFPLLPMYRFKDKEQLLNKLKTYLTFS